MLFEIFFAIHSVPVYWMCIDYSKQVCNVAVVKEQEVKDRVDESERFLLSKKIKYCRWWAGPKCYDCSWILTEALRAWWWKFDKKLSSSSLYANYKHVPFNQARRWDILVTHDGKTHVALITQGYKNWTVTVLDYVKKHSTASYRKYWKIPDTVIIRLK